MLKRVLFMLMTLFVCTLGSVAMGDDATLFKINGTEIQKPYSCTFNILDTYGDEDILMTPIFRKNCDIGYYNSSNEQCDVVSKYCDPGNYLDLTTGTPVCTPCPAGYWCPSRYLSVETINESADVCGDGANVAEGGKTETNANYKWENGQCIDKATNEVVNGINSESECGYTSVGKCKCPGETTTSADRKETSGLRSTSISACLYYDLKPGQQLKRTEDTEHNYKWENGQCIDKDTNLPVPSITSAAYCGYNYSKEECDADNFCMGRVVTAAKYDDSMEACPDKYNDIVTIENAQDCATAAVNGFTWTDAEDGAKCFITGTSVVVSNVTTSWACDNANQIKNDLVWNTSEGKCLLKGHADTGSFRCSYTCPAGYYMHITNQYDGYSRYISDYYTSKYFLGGWKALYTTCEPCPVGSYCLGGTFFLDATHNDTKYHADTYSTEQPKYYAKGTSLGITGCPTNSTTLGTGSYTATQCKSFCPAGQYYNAAEGHKQCESCLDAGLDADAYCPGGILYDENTSENVGISTCDQQNVMIYGTNISDSPIHITPESDDNNYVQPNASRSACTCPSGYEWNATTRACCEPNKACCGAGLELHTYKDGTYECKPCGSGNEEEDENCSIICLIDEQSQECIDCRNSNYCPGSVLTIRTECVLGENQYRKDGKCLTCPTGSLVNDGRTGCICTLSEMTADNFPELNDDPNPGLVRHWDGSKCELDEYYVGVRYTTIDLNGNTYPHGQSCGWNSQCDYWYKYYRYGQVKNNNQYVEANSFNIAWNPSENGYSFSNPVTPDEVLENPESMSGRKVQDGYLFAGWCRETTFCCPAGYQVHDLGSGKKECVMCPNGDKTSEECNGSKWVSPDTKPVIDTKAPENKKGTSAGFKYYAMMVADHRCEPGYYLNTTTLNCDICPIGHWCPGGVVSPRDTGLRNCPKDTYRDQTGATQKTYNANPEQELKEQLGFTYDGCKSCTDGVSEELSNRSGTTIQVPADNGLVTQLEASTSVNQCGYYCSQRKYDAADNRFKCDETCTAGWYCPGAGPVPDRSDYLSAFYTWNQQGKGRLECPEGLNSDAGARQCYTDPGCSVDHYQWRNGQCIDEDTEEVVTDITEESECHYIGYYKKKNSSGAYECVICDGNNPSAGVYYACPGIGNVNVPLVNYQTVHQDSVGKNRCGSNQMSDEHGDHCYALTNAGMYIDPATGNTAQCQINHFCTGREEDGVYGQKKCPYGSVSDVGAQTITDCHCVSGANYMPTGAYIEKGAELQYDANTNEYICVNTYLVVGNVNSYSSAPDDAIPNAEARVVSCAWVNNQENPGEDDAPDGVYRNCTPAAMDICYKSDWENQSTSSVSTSDVLNELARVIYENDENEEHKSAKYLLANMMRASDVKNISTVNNWDSCRGLSVCPEDFEHFDDEINVCYAAIGYQGLDYEGVSFNNEETNPIRYDSNDLPITLVNPTRPHHEFKGWCLSGESGEDCLANTVHTENEIEIVERAIPTGTGGDLTFVAQWQMVCPVDYSHYTGELTDVTQCYATVDFNTNGGTPVPETIEKHYTEGATTYTLTEFPSVALTGYNLDGWYDNASFDGAKVELHTEEVSGTELLGDTTLYAKWNPISYTVAFDGNGATDGSTESETFEYDEEKALTANGYSRTGYNFNGWCDAWNSETNACATGAKNYSDEQTVSNLTDEDNATITMFAKWNPITYSISYNGMDDAQVSVDPTTGDSRVNPTSYTVEDNIVVYDAADTDEYEFLGWCEGVENPTCSEPQKDMNWLAGSKLGDLVFTAQWRALACPETYPNKDTETNKCYASITYVGMEGAVLPYDPENPTERLINPDRYDANTVLPIVLNNPEKDYYDFAGWYENDVLVTEIAASSTGNKTYLATWTPIEYTITYHGVDGEDVKWPEDPENAGAYLTNPGSYNVDSADITLYNPSRDLYTFVGWCDDEELTVNCSTTKTIESGSYGNKDFWAKWTLNSYTVEFDANATDTDSTKSDVSCTYGVACDDITNNNEITRTDYGFIGWSTDKNATTAEYTTTITQNTELPGDTLKLYAIWTPVCDTGKYLHIGDDVKMCLYTTSRTTPSLVIMIDNVKYYANMCKASECDKTITGNTERKLDIMYNDEVYNVYDLTAQ